MAIQLWFNSSGDPQLTKILFSCPLTGSKIWSYRGRGTWKGDGSFPWTAGVKALCSLLLAVRLSGQSGISGPKGSLASSLDFALGKPPAWLNEMFGQLPNGAPTISKLFIRMNPEGKRNSPFEVRVNPELIRSEQIQIFADGVLLDTPQIRHLFRNLTGNPTTDITSLLERPDFVQAVEDHMVRSYNSVDIFTQQGRAGLLKRIYDHPGFKKFAPLNARITHPVDDALMNRGRLGIVDNEIRTILRSRTEPIRLTSNMPTIPITTLFRYMSRLYDIPMEIDMSYLHAAEVGKRIVANDFATPPDLSVLGLGPASAIISLGPKSGYQPITPLPASYDELLCGAAPEEMKQNSHFSFIDDFPSTPRLFFERLTDAKKISSRANPVVHFEPADSIAMTMQEKNARTILFFPYNIVAKLYYGLHRDTSLPINGNITEMILFGNNKFLSDTRYLKAFLIAMRDAWLRLRANPELQRTLRAELLALEEYKRTFARSVEIPLKIAA